MHTFEVLELAAAIVPSRTATVLDSERQTFAALAARAGNLAAFLAANGVRAGERIAVMDVNTPVHLEAHFAAARLGAIHVPLNFRWRAEELAFPLRHASPKALIAGERYVSAIAAAMPRGRRVPVRIAAGAAPPGWTAYGEAVASGATPPAPAGHASDTAVLLFTAGTTGTPKAVMLSHESFTSYLLANVEPADPDTEERTLLSVPLYHIAGLQAALAAVYGGRTLVMQRQFEPEAWLDLVQQERVRRAFLVPTMLKQVLDHPAFATHDLSSLRVITYGGAPMPSSLIERAITALPAVQFINAFGQTESASTIAMVPPEDHVLQGPPEVVAKRRKRLTSIGLPLPDVEVLVVDEAGHPVHPGVTGEIITHGARLMRGYWRQPTETAQVLRDGWLYTGDLATVDEDGYIYLQGRAKDFIKRGGEMVAPEEVEAVLYGHPGVEECAVVGVPDETWGEHIVAVVVPKPGVAALAAGLQRLCQRYLARFKRPDEFVFVEALPRNALGKILKHELRERLAAQTDTR